MTRKDYELIAKAIKRQVDAARSFPGDQRLNGAALDHLDNLASDIAGELLADNPKFNPQRFLDACGFKGDL